MEILVNVIKIMSISTFSLMSLQPISDPNSERNAIFNAGKVAADDFVIILEEKKIEGKKNFIEMKDYKIEMNEEDSHFNICFFINQEDTMGGDVCYKISREFEILSRVRYK